MRKVFYTVYLILTIAGFIGMVYSFHVDKMKESFIYMLLTISLGVITIMLEPRRDKDLQEKIDTMGVIALVGVLIVTMIFVFTTRP